MIDLQKLRDPDYVDQLQAAADVKGIRFSAKSLAEAVTERRRVQGDYDTARGRQKLLRGEAAAQCAAEVKDLQARLRVKDALVHHLALLAPSIPDALAPVGFTDADNRTIRRVGEPRRMDDGMLDHIELSEKLGLADFGRARKFAGGRSYALTGNGVLLARAVLDLAMDMLVVKGFTPVSPPVMVRDLAMEGTGFFPLGYDDAYQAGDLFLVGTSEVSLVSLHRDEIIDGLPVRYAGISSCFRREAGSHGKDTKGFYRVHQFDKVEQVSIIPADDNFSFVEQHYLLGNAEAVLAALELPYRVAVACTGETGQGQRLKYEVETWMPSRDGYCETHSCSSFGDFQARRSNIRYRDGEGKLRFAYTLNNTAVAVPRILIPLLEHHQQESGNVNIPAALRPYLGGVGEIGPNTKPGDLVRNGP